MEERPETELISIPATPRASTPEILTPSGQRSPRPASKEAKSSTAWTPTSFISPRFLSPIGTPMKRVLINMKGYLEEVGHLTKLNPQDAWLPITESRNGNAHYAAFHNLNAGVGVQSTKINKVSFTIPLDKHAPKESGHICRCGEGSMKHGVIHYISKLLLHSRQDPHVHVLIDHCPVIF
ncbi:hypothetical protein NC652_021665 [Populus alba x Populus x berolinensis]|nr:hypothetical protein NC652_021665 [Populus alba x Populus x berolinensis]